jgi:Kinesin motor domain
MAYGQTGSGKTFTMGSEVHAELEILSNTGLIPRFMNALFENLGSAPDNDFRLETSFLEVYGEDVHDLMDVSRASLPLRDDSCGGVVCAGLTSKQVKSAQEAAQVLHEGTSNRTTAATLMNLTSSRSHAVFTVTLTRNGANNKLTFVDLAGSERLKKTGAEGERAREGIEINKGLLALGNVINALTDEDRMQNGAKKKHVPYRQSKLTRLLQDALGGNSQTLFLACVSTTDTNASETLSTLHYANRARNVQNAPIRNVDVAKSDAHHLQAYVSVLQAELIRLKFGGGSTSESPTGEVSEELLSQKEVSAYLATLHLLAQQKSANAVMVSNAALAKNAQIRPYS